MLLKRKWSDFGLDFDFDSGGAGCAAEVGLVGPRLRLRIRLLGWKWLDLDFDFEGAWCAPKVDVVGLRLRFRLANGL